MATPNRHPHLSLLYARHHSCVPTTTRWVRDGRCQHRVLLSLLVGSAQGHFLWKTDCYVQPGSSTPVSSLPVVP